MKLPTIIITVSALILGSREVRAQKPEPEQKLEPLEVSFEAISGPLSGGQIFFDATAMGGDANYTFSWDFGDGETSSSEDTLHNYFKSGTYTVEVTVTDGLKESAVASADVKIAAVPESSVKLQILHSSDNESSFQNPQHAGRKNSSLRRSRRWPEDTRPS